MDCNSAETWFSLLARYPQRSVDTSLGTISIREAGTGPALVLLHGIGSGSGSWIPQLDHLSGHFRVIAWDAPGYGDSDPIAGSPTPDVYARRLEALAEELSLGRFPVVGHSLGALIAGRFATLLPDRVTGLVLADPASGHARLSDEDRARRLASRLEPFQKMGAARYAEERAPNLLAASTSADNLSFVQWNMAHLTLDGLRAAAMLLSSGDLIGDVAAYNGAALVLCGSEDRVTPPSDCEAVAKAFPEPCPFRLIAGAGHASYIDAPDVFARHVRDFLEQAA